MHTIIDAMIALIGEPSRWTKGVNARDEAGQPVDPCSPEARQWDILGALERATAGDAALADAVEGLLREAWPNLLSLAALNDDRTTAHSDIVAFLRRARERLAVAA